MFPEIEIINGGYGGTPSLDLKELEATLQQYEVGLAAHSPPSPFLDPVRRFFYDFFEKHTPSVLVKLSSPSVSAGLWACSAFQVGARGPITSQEAQIAELRRKNGVLYERRRLLVDEFLGKAREAEFKALYLLSLLEDPSYSKKEEGDIEFLVKQVDRYSLEVINLFVSIGQINEERSMNMQKIVSLSKNKPTAEKEIERQLKSDLDLLKELDEAMQLFGLYALKIQNKLKK